MNEVSVVIPCYNSEATLERALDSLSDQTFKKFEVLVINDGSTDNTKELIQNYSLKNKLYIRYFEQKNSGVSVARNYGIKEAANKFLLFLDSDDVYHKNFIKVLYEKVKLDKVDTAMTYTTKDMKQINTSLNISDYPFKHLKKQEKVMEKFLYEKENLSFASFIYRKEILDKYSIQFPVGVRTAEDLEFIWKYLCHCQTAYLCEIPLYGYIENKESVTNMVFWERTHSFMVFQKIGDYIKTYNPSFYLKYEKHMYPRVIWSYAKTFASGGNKIYFNKLNEEFNMKYYMRILVTNAKDWRVSVTALVYTLSPLAFFYLIKLLFYRKNS